MALEIQRAVLTLLARCIDGELLDGATPAWLQRPGAAECGGSWSTVRTIYHALTGGELPQEMPPRERRTVDAVLNAPSGSRIVEVDERQHFTPARAVTLQHYASGSRTAFDRAEWRRRSLSTRRPSGGGFARKCPPLFPDAGGRHLQRAFRDALADLVPLEHCWLPTLRIADWEVAGWIERGDAQRRMANLLEAKLT
jgi:hypothetical protein